MTAAELIEALKAMPQDLPVTFRDGEWGDIEVTSVSVGSAYIPVNDFRRSPAVIINDEED